MQIIVVASTISNKDFAKYNVYLSSNEFVEYNMYSVFTHVSSCGNYFFLCLSK